MVSAEQVTYVRGLFAPTSFLRTSSGWGMSRPNFLKAPWPCQTWTTEVARFGWTQPKGKKLLLMKMVFAWPMVKASFVMNRSMGPMPRSRSFRSTFTRSSGAYAASSRSVSVRAPSKPPCIRLKSTTLSCFTGSRAPQSKQNAKTRNPTPLMVSFREDTALMRPPSLSGTPLRRRGPTGR